VFVSVCVMNYLAAFTGKYRNMITAKWLALCLERGIKVSREFSFSQSMSSQMEIREWAISGLPSDKVSIDNAIMTTRAHRWPLLIDPQFQALNWLKKTNKSSQDASNFVCLKVPKASGSDDSSD
jgi:dynein heavy chain, axonemal